MTKKTRSLADVIMELEEMPLEPTRRRDLVSAINRVAAMASQSPAGIAADPAVLRGLLAAIRPAAHDVSAKTFANLRSAFASALERVEAVERLGRGAAARDPAWAPLMLAISGDKRLGNGLAAFANYCSSRGVEPSAVSDPTVQEFMTWLQTRTLYPKPKDVVRRVPVFWNEAAHKVDAWPKQTLSRISFRPPRTRLQWEELPAPFRIDAEKYLAGRGSPDVFDQDPGAPSRRWKPTTLRLHRDYTRLAASALVETGLPLESLASLADLVRPDCFKAILRHYHSKAGGEANAFAEGMARALLQVAKYHCKIDEPLLDELKAIKRKLPPLSTDMTEKNKKLIREFESESHRAKLMFLPVTFVERVKKALEKGMLLFVDAQIAIAVDICLVAPLRPENLAALVWGRHLLEPDGPRGKLLLHIPASETKTGKQDLIFELPPDVAARLRWYRKEILPRLQADQNGPLFAKLGGGMKGQDTISDQIIERIGGEVGVHMTPHQFRHLAAVLYLEEHPEDFETVRALLGHSWAKTTLRYAGSSTRRAGKAFGAFVMDQREKLLLKRKPPRKNGAHAHS